MDNFQKPVCAECKHFNGNRSCSAFDFIPDVIWMEGNNHSTTIENQSNEFVYESTTTVEE